MPIFVVDYTLVKTIIIEEQALSEKVIYLRLTDKDDPKEFKLVDDWAKTKGLKRTTALKMHIRETLPQRIAQDKIKNHQQQQVSAQYQD